MGLRHEKERIRSDAEFALEICKKRAESRDLELDDVTSEFLKAFGRSAKMERRKQGRQMEGHVEVKQKERRQHGSE